MKVLYLTPWYPSEHDAMAGLFVKKHADAVRAQGCEVRVIFSQGWFDTWRQWRALKRNGWMPDVVQLNVIQKQGLLALYLKRRYHIPYIIVEHWSGYLPENGQFMRTPKISQAIYKFIAKNAEMLLTVSLPLQRAMLSCGIEAKRWGTIDNVVDDFFYEKKEKAKSGNKTLLHVSCFDEHAKNVKGLLRAVKMLAEKRQDWQLVLIGTGVDYTEVRAFADKLEIPAELLQWTGEITPLEVAKRMHRADALVLSSRYETYGVVLAEAAAAGLPILSTPVGIAEETADLIVPQEIAQNKPGSFAEFIGTILFKADVIQKPTKNRTPKNNDTKNQFSADAIGKKLISVYEEVQQL